MDFFAQLDETFDIVLPVVALGMVVHAVIRTRFGGWRAFWRQCRSECARLFGSRTPPPGFGIFQVPFLHAYPPPSAPSLTPGAPEMEIEGPCGIVYPSDQEAAQPEP